MPFKSKAQRAFLHIHHPEMAKRWEKETPKDAKLPEKVKTALALRKTAGGTYTSGQPIQLPQKPVAPAPAPQGKGQQASGVAGGVGAPQNAATQTTDKNLATLKQTNVTAVQGLRAQAQKTRSTLPPAGGAALAMQQGHAVKSAGCDRLIARILGR